MDEERLLARLERIDALAARRRGCGAAAAGELLSELRGLLRDAEELAGERTGGEAREEVVGRRRTALLGT